MKKCSEHHFLITFRDGLPMAASLVLPESGEGFSLVIFVHGFKGFKDWGHFPLLTRMLAAEGFAVLRFNFSHNGTTPAQPDSFADLPAFGRNTYSRELSDLEDVLNALPQLPEASRINLQALTLWGHSRGGGIATVCASEQKRVRALITWAAVADLPARVLGADTTSWRRNGVIYTSNARTKQEMPLGIGLLLDTEKNAPRFDAAAAASRLQIPHLILHGDADAAVPQQEAMRLKQNHPEAELHILPGADHTFGGKHPFESMQLPAHAQEAFAIMLRFLSN
ncbi:MAG: alpha/beta fold hydrolase [Bacteroidetes bacterium]|nr:alpha/beta fold hydrolase [Bacteroidota bacterium]